MKILCRETWERLRRLAVLTAHLLIRLVGSLQAVIQGISVDTQSFGCPGEISIIQFESFLDVLDLELLTCLLERNAIVNQLPDQCS